MKEYILETDRLLLRKLQVEDAEVFYALNEDEEVVKYTGDRAFASVDEARTFIANYDQYNYRLGRWAVETKENKEFIGWSGLKFNLGSGEIDLGFRYSREYWGKGYATEAAYACLYYAFEELSLFDVIGRAQKANMASVKVLEKVGMKFQTNFDFEGNDGAIFISRNFQFERKAESFVSIL